VAGADSARPGRAGDRLVVRCLAPKAHEAELAFAFQAQRWYHIALTHSAGSAVASSWLRLFVNGTLEASARARYPKARGASREPAARPPFAAMPRSAGVVLPSCVPAQCWCGPGLRPLRRRRAGHARASECGTRHAV